MLRFILFIPLIILLFLFENSIKNFFQNYVFEDDLKKLIIHNKNISFIDFQIDRYKKSSRFIIFVILLPLFNFNLYYFALIIFLSYFAYKKPYWSYKKKYKESISLVKYQFPIWLRQIQILLHNNNVVNSLEFSLQLAPDIIKKDLENLIIQLNRSPNDINVFTNFMDYLEISEINRAMKLLYRCYLVDKDESAKQLNRMIASTTKWIRQERISRQKDKLSYFEWIGIIPLLGVTIIFLVIMASLITNLFEGGVGI